MEERHSTADRLSSLVGVRRGEWHQAWPALLFAFVAVGVTSLSTIATDTLFVSRFPLGEVSRFYVVSSIVRVATAFGYAELARRFPSHRRDTGVFAAAAMAMITSGVLAQTGGSAAIYVACVMQLLLPPFLPLIAFNSAMSCFHVRQAKRLLPLVAAASTVGTIAVAAGARAVAPVVGTPYLLHIGAVMALLAAPLPALLDQRARAAGVDDDPAPPKTAQPAAGVLTGFLGTARDVRDVPVVRIVVLYSVLGAALTAFVDFGFKAALKSRFGRDEMAAYLGAFAAISNAAVLFVQLFLTSRVVARFGVRSALQVAPGVLAVLSPGMLLAPGVLSASALKFADTVLRFSLGGSVADMLLTPAPTDVRTRAKVMVKGLATPLGGLVAGGVLVAFGQDGPGLRWCGALVIATGALGVFLTIGARRAYASALARALGEGRLGFDLTAVQADLLRAELARALARAAEAGDVRGAQRALAVMSERVFQIEDLAPALRAHDPAIRQAAADAAARLARPGEGERLLALAAPDGDDEVELRILETARALGATVPIARIQRALDVSQQEDGPGVDLWAAALVALAQHPAEKDAAVKKLRKAALEADSPRRAAALRALGELRERRAEREILRALASTDAHVFAEAARAGVLVDAPGIVPTLTSRLATGPHVRATARALALAGRSAITELIAILPTTLGEGAVAPTAVASARTVAGTVRAARVLARLGPEACVGVLDRFHDLGYRGRNAVARALATVPRSTGRAIDEERVRRATEVILAYAESLVRGFRTLGPGLLREEVLHRIGETAVRVLDLTSVIGERASIERARAALSRHERQRGHALELLETVLPRALARRTVGLLEMDLDGDGTGGDALDAVRPGLGAVGSGAPSVPPPPASGGAPAGRAPSVPPPRSGPTRPFDGWLEKCRQFDEGDAALDPAMRALLEKVLVLRRSSLFMGLSGEELYPVAEIAAFAGFGAEEVVIREGEPGDALFVVGAGSLGILRGETKVRELGAGAAFGEMALLDGAPRAATVIAVTEAQLLRIPREEFEHLFDEYPELARGVIRVLLGHLRAAA